ncbi:MAG: carboxypeptidase-like regulatory domain-containing protein, partial [Planctomycetota bacterium]
VRELWRNSSDSLTAWEKAATSPKADYYSLRESVPKLTNGPQLQSMIPSATTDDRGRFVLRGIGRQRVVELFVSGPEIETAIIKARTSDGDVVTVPHQFGFGAVSSMRETYQPRTFTHVAAPSRPLRGKVVDDETGNPVENVRVSAGSVTTFTSFGKSYLSATTRADGTFDLPGLSLSGDSLFVMPPRGSRYLPQGARPAFTKGDGPVTLDLRLTKAPIIRGRVTDDRNGKPVKAAIQYFAKSDNEFLARHPGFKQSGSHEVVTDEDGRFEIAVSPGEGYLSVLAFDHAKYKRAGQHPKGTFASPAAAPGMYRTYPSLLMVANFHHVEPVAIAPAANVESADQEIDIALGSGAEFIAEVVDADGKPVTDFVYLGESESSGWRTARDGKLFVRGYYEDRPREVIVFHKATNSAARLGLTGKAPRKLVVQLEPAASIRGRLLDDRGLPLANKKVFGDAVVKNDFGKPEYTWATDDQGRFGVLGILPGRKYSLWVMTSRGMVEFIAKDVATDSATGKDLGDITVK